MPTERRARRTLDPKLDIVFWKLFSAERNRPLLIALLNAVMRPPVPIDSVVVVGEEPEVLSVDGKQIALDLRVRLASGEEVDVEVQTRRHAALRERALYYWSRLYSEQLPRGAEYLDLHRCVVIFILDFEELTAAGFHSIFRLRADADGEQLTEHIELHFVELPKWQRSWHRNDEPSLAAWCRFLTATADEELETLAMENPILKQAKEALEELSADPEVRRRAWHRETVLNADLMQRTADKRQAEAEGRAQGLAAGREEGLAAGREEGLAAGREEGLAEALLRVLTRKFGVLPASVVERVGHASQAEVNDWLDRLLTADSIESVFGP